MPAVILNHTRHEVKLQDYPPVTPASIQAAKEAAHAERLAIEEAIGRPLPLHPMPEFHPVAPHQRLDDYRKDEKCGVDLIAEAIAARIYGKHYDELPREQRIPVECAALRALRSPLGPWKQEARTRALRAFDEAMREEMGFLFAQMPEVRRMYLGSVAVQCVISAFISALELDNPFDGPGDALKVYDAAAADVRVVR